MSKAQKLKQQRLAAVVWYIAPVGIRIPGRDVQPLPPRAIGPPAPPAGWQIILNVWQN
jgi:hypothetical protein